MKNLIKIIIVILFVTTISNAQVTGGQYALNISSATATSNTIDFTLTVTVNSPSPGMRIFGFQAGINFNPAMVNGGILSAIYIGGRSTEFANMSFGTVNATFPGTVRIPLSNFPSGATSVDIVVGTTYTLGTYRITNTVNWANENANLWLQDVAQTGRTRSAVNGYPFGLATPQYAYSTTTPVSPAGLVLSHSAASPYSLSLGTLNTYDFDYQGLQYYPNPVTDILTVTNNATISTVSLYNLLGQEILSKEINATEGKIDVSSLPEATYLLKIKTEDKVKTAKIIKK